MSERRVVTFSDEQNELELKTVLFENFAVDFGNEISAGDCWFWFISVENEDRWFAFSVSDTPDHADERVGSSDIEELRRMSIWLGKPWDQIMATCPHCEAVKQRQIRNEMGVQIFEDLMEVESLDKLKELRREGEWKTIQDTAMASSGLHLSLN